MRKRDRLEPGPVCKRCGITNRESRSFCRACGLHLKPAALKRDRIIVPYRRNALRRESYKRNKERPTREALIAAVHERDRTCQAFAAHDLVGVKCGGRLEVHEIIPRSQWAAGYLVIENTVLLCHNFHAWVTDHPQGAHALGFRRWSYERDEVAR